MTNIAEVDENDRIVIKPYHTGAPHGCTNPCGENLCKGREVQRIIATEAPSRIAYIGDGSNDWCPVEKLRKYARHFAPIG